MRKTKRVISLALAAILTAGMVSGCSSQNKNSGSSKDAAELPAVSSEKKSGDTEAASETASVSSGEKTQVICWHHDGDKYDDEWWKYYVSEYNKSHDDVEIVFQAIPGDAWDQKLKAAQSTGTAPDIYDLPLSGVAQAVTQNTLMAFDDYVDPSVWDDLTDIGRQYANLNGSYWCFPRYVEPSAMLIYRKDMFKAAGLDPEKPPTTWDELIEYGKLLTTDTVYGINMPTGEGDMSWTTWGMQVQLSGHSALLDDWSAADVANEGYAQLLAFFKRIFDEGIAPPQAIDGYSQAETIAQGKVAMQMCGTWELGSLKTEYPDEMDNIGYSFFPTPDGDYKKPTASLGGWSMVLDGKAKHPQEAADFLTYLMAEDPARLADYFARGEYCKSAPWKSVEDYLAKDEEASKVPYRAVIAEKIAPYAVTEPLYPWDVSVTFGQAFNKVLLENVEPMEALKEAENIINDFIKKNNLAGKNYN